MDIRALYKSVQEEQRQRSENKQTKGKVEQLLITKYSPKTIDEIVLNDSLKLKFKKMIETKVSPNILINGSCGTGKSSLLKIFSQALSGGDSMRTSDYMLVLNACDVGGLDVLIGTMESFCSRLTMNGSNIQMKYVVIDELDIMTTKSQNAIANIINEYSSTVTFLFACNEMGEISESIQSKCLCVYLQPLKHSQVLSRLVHICEHENIKYNDDGSLNMIASISKGDLRSAINILESVNDGFNIVTLENTEKISFQPRSRDILHIIQCCASKKLKEAISTIESLKKMGYCGSDIVLALYNAMQQVQINEDVRFLYLRIISETYITLMDGLDTDIQIYACVSKLSLLLKH